MACKGAVKLTPWCLLRGGREQKWATDHTRAGSLEQGAEPPFEPLDRANDPNRAGIESSDRTSYFEQVQTIPTHDMADNKGDDRESRQAQGNLSKRCVEQTG
jgi:hypothetical protein